LVLDNKTVYICFLLALMPALVIMAASPMRAADTSIGASGVSAGPVQAAVSSQVSASTTTTSKKFVVRIDRRTGKLVRVAEELRPAASPAKNRTELNSLVQQAARAHNVDPLLVESVIQVESNYDPNAISSKGAEGLMQLMPATARMLGVSNSFDPQQ